MLPDRAEGEVRRKIARSVASPVRTKCANSVAVIDRPHADRQGLRGAFSTTSDAGRQALARPVFRSVRSPLSIPL